MSRPSRRIRPEILTLRVDADRQDLRTTPTRMYGASAEKRAIERIGRDAYTVLRTRALVGLSAQQSALVGVPRHLEDAVTQRDAIASGTGTGDLAAAAFDAETVGQETHWHAIHRVGQAVESLCSVIGGLEAYRDGRRDDIARHLVRHDLDVHYYLQSKALRKVSHWERLSGRPDHLELGASGLDRTSVQSLLAANRSWATGMMVRFQAIAAFYSVPLHRVYAKYRHGYTLVSPSVSPIFVSLDGRPAEAVDRAIKAGFVVMDEARDGRRSVHVIASGVPQIRQCLSMAELTLNVARSIATSWLIQVEHAEHRTIAFAERDRNAVRQWIGSGLDDAYGPDLIEMSSNSAPSAEVD